MTYELLKQAIAQKLLEKEAKAGVTRKYTQALRDEAAEVGGLAGLRMRMSAATRDSRLGRKAKAALFKVLRGSGEDGRLISALHQEARKDLTQVLKESKGLK